MRRYWLPAECIQSDSVQIDGDSFHHIFGVCRQEMGSRFEVLNGPEALLVEVDQVGKGQAKARVLSKRSLPQPKKPHLILALAIPRPAVFDAILEKSVEMGITAIWPLKTEHSFFRDSGKWETKERRHMKIIQSATQQSGRGDWMNLEAPMTLTEAFEKLNRIAGTKGLFLYEGDGTDVGARLKEKAESWVLFVGSEGGFSQSEVAQFRERGMPPVSLGEQVLRVETACLVGMSILKYELGHLKN